MSIDTNTANVLLCFVVGLQTWIVRELFKLKGKIALLVSVCPMIKGNKEFDTDRITHD